MSFTETWQSASTSERPEAPEPGQYDAMLEDAKALLSKKDEAWVILSWKVTSLRNKDHQWDELLGFRSSRQAGVTKATIAKLGVDVDNVTALDDLDGALKSLIGQQFELEVKQSGQYRNTYVLGVSSAPAPPVADPTSPEADDDSVPF